MNSRPHNGAGLAAAVVLTLASSWMSAFPDVAYGQSEEELQTLLMFYDPDELVITATRSRKPISQVAEDLTVVTAEEIRQLNAHTLTDVLWTVPGVQVDLKGGPGSPTFPLIQGADYRHVLVTVDGVTLNNLSDNFPDAGSIPVQNIERIEIVKGPASSAWGSALGGVINIVTKDAGTTAGVNGMVSGSYGEFDTSDMRGEISGKEGPVGYYVTAESLRSHGLTPGNMVSNQDIYTKLRWEVCSHARLTFTLGHHDGDRDNGEDRLADLAFQDEYERLFGTLSLNVALGKEWDLDLSVASLRLEQDQLLRQRSTGSLLDSQTSTETTHGLDAKATWRHGGHTMVAGADFSAQKLEAQRILGGEAERDRWALYLNDTISAGRWALTPGLRYDETDTNGDFLSPTLGVTYSVSKKTILRASVARGFSLPGFSETVGGGPFFVPDPDLDVEKVWSYQVGMESQEIGPLWIKVAGFHHRVTDALAQREVLGEDGLPLYFTIVNTGKQRLRGFEIEAKTVPVLKTSLRAAYTFVDAEDTRTDETVLGVPRYTWDVGLHFDDRKGLQAALKGHYVWWNEPAADMGDYNSFIWDIHLQKRFSAAEARTLELYASVRNIFDGSQYQIPFYPNPGRWVEAGLRFEF